MSTIKKVAHAFGVMLPHTKQSNLLAVGPNSMKIELEKKLEAARGDSIVILGIGGYVKAKDFKTVFKEIDAETFARIMYATEQMLDDFDGAESVNPKNIPLTIAKYNFEEKQHFSQVAGLFRKHLGSTIVSC